MLNWSIWSFDIHVYKICCVLLHLFTLNIFLLVQTLQGSLEAARSQNEEAERYFKSILDKGVQKNNTADKHVGAYNLAHSMIQRIYAAAKAGQDESEKVISPLVKFIFNFLLVHIRIKLFR